MEGDGVNLSNPQLNLRFCNESQVYRKHKMFLLFKAAFLTKHMFLQQQGRNLGLMEQIYAWIEENIDEMFKSFMESKPTYEELLFVHRWYKPDQYAMQMAQNKKINVEHVTAIWTNKLKMALYNLAEHQLVDHKRKLRLRQVYEHKFKLFKSKNKFEDKVQFFNQHIEMLVRDLTSREYNLYSRELRRIRKQTLKNSIIMNLKTHQTTDGDDVYAELTK